MSGSDDNFNATALPTTYQYWWGVPTFLRCPYRPDFSETDIGLIGVPHAGGNPVGRMQYLGPRSIRNRSAGYHRYHREFRVDPFSLARVSDLGDTPITNTLHPDMAADDIEAFFARVYAAGIATIAVGGDHSVTGPILRAARKTSQPAPLGLIHFDSHNDAFPAFESTRNHAGPFRMASEEGVIDPKRTVQIGIRGAMSSPDMDDWAIENFGAVVTTDAATEQGPDAVAALVRQVVGDGPTYLSFDLDAIDPVFAPGVATPEVNGLMPREVFRILRGLRGLNIVGADVVCHSPPNDDPAQNTAMLASQILLDLVVLVGEARQRAG
jgi:guanidinopropionase